MRYAVVILVAAHIAWLARSATLQSPTLNEPGHLAAGLAIWELGRLDIYRVNPPLTKALAALPVVFAGGERDWNELSGAPGSRSEFALGRAFIHANGENVMRLLVLARWMCIPFSALGAVMCYVWGDALYGRAAGFCAALLWCLEPNIIAHGQLITPDSASASLVLATSYAFWRWLASPTQRTAVASGILLGLLELAKLTWILLVPLWLLVWLAHVVTRRHGTDAPKVFATTGREFRGLLLQLCLAVGIVNLGYCFDGTGSRLCDLRFISRSLSGNDFATMGPGNRFADCWLGALPIPLPRQYILGLDHQRRDFEVFPMRSYLRGEWRQGGWWYYYLYALVIKTPLAVLCVLCGAALFALYDTLFGRRAVGAESGHTGGRDRFWGLVILVMPAASVFVLASAQTAFNHHFRYVLPVLGPIFVLASSLAERAGRPARRCAGAIIIVCLAWMGVSSFRHGWESLSYFNELIGGPKAGRFHLLHSNLDWGQDLLRLKAWQAQHPDVPPLAIAYSGLYDPADLGLRVTSVDAAEVTSKERAPEWYAISVNYLMGSEWPPVPFDCSAFAVREPCAWCGSSIAVFRVLEAQGL